MKSTSSPTLDRAVIEARRRRDDHRAGLGHRHQVPQVDQRERRLPRHQDQLAPLLQRHVRGPLHQRAAGAGGDRRDRAHRAGTDHHARGPLRAGGGKRPAIAVGERHHRRPVSAGGLPRAPPASRCRIRPRSSRMPCDEAISQTGTRCRASTSSSRTPYGAPEAPVIARTTGTRRAHRSQSHAVAVDAGRTRTPSRSSRRSW